MLAGNYDARNAGLLAECGPTNMKQNAAIRIPRKGHGMAGTSRLRLWTNLNATKDWDKLHPLRPMP